MSRITSNIKVLDSVTTGTTSGIFDVSMAKKLSLHCLDTASVVGTCNFTVQVSNDGTNFVSYTRMTTNSVAGALSSQVYTDHLKLSSLTTSGILFFPDTDIFRNIKVIATKSHKNSTSGGTFSVRLQTID